MPSYTTPNGSISPSDAQTMSAHEKSLADSQNSLYGNYPQATAPSQPITPGSTTQIWISNYDGGRTDNDLPKQGTVSTAF